jgi:glycogen operon protein
MTLYDVFSYGQKQNGCGPLNPACCGTPVSPFCDATGGESNNRSRDWGQDPAGEAQKRQLMRGLFTYLAIGRGTPMILGGDEWMRTQLGNNNAWSADNSAAWFDWGGWSASDERQRMHDFVRGLLQLRRTHAYAFAPADWSGAAPFAWKDERNQDGVAWGGRHAALHYWDGARGPQLDILINHEATPITFALPSGVRWGRLVDTQSWFDGPGWFDGSPGRPSRLSANVSLSAPAAVGGNYTVASGSVVILEEQR